MLILFRPLWSPMPAACLQVRPTCIILHQFELAELRLGCFQAIANPTQAPVARAIRSPGDSKREVAAVREERAIRLASGLSQQVRNQVEIPNRTEEVSDRPELLVRVHLFQVGLGQALVVRLVLVVRTVKNHLSIPFHDFAGENRPVQATRFPSKRQLVGPSIRPVADPPAGRLSTCGRGSSSSQRDNVPSVFRHGSAPPPENRRRPMRSAGESARRPTSWTSRTRSDPRRRDDPGLESQPP